MLSFLFTSMQNYVFFGWPKNATIISYNSRINFKQTIVTGLTYLNSKNGNGIVVRREARDATYSSEHEIKKILGNGAHGGSPAEFIKKNLNAYETADRLQNF